MKIVPFALIGVLGLACIAPVFAQKKVAPQVVAVPVSDAVPPEKAASIHRLLTLMGTVKLSQQMMGQMTDSMQAAMPQVPAEFWAKMRTSMNANELVDMMVPIYSRHYTQAEIDGLIAFYQTPLGQKVIAEQPQISQESMTVGQQWGMQKGQEIQQQILQEQADLSAKAKQQ